MRGPPGSWVYRQIASSLWWTWGCGRTPNCRRLQSSLQLQRLFSLPTPPPPHLSFQKALTSPPPFLGFSRVPAMKRGTSKPKGPGPSCGPLHGYLGSGDLRSPPASPTIAPDVAAGERWVQGPASSGHLVVLLLQSQHILCQLARPPHSALPRPNF